MPYFIDEDYQALYEIMAGAGFAEDFAAYFQQNPETGFWDCTNETEYRTWLAGIFGDEPYDDFVNWGGFEQIKSTQGGGVG